MSNHGATFWNDVFLRMEDIKSVAPQSHNAMQSLRENIGHLAEVYDRRFDPVDHFNEYVVVRLLQEINTKLTASEP